MNIETELIRIFAKGLGIDPRKYASGAGALILGWRVKSVRYWTLLSVLIIVCEGVFSMTFFWPRNEIMFIEGTAVHSAEFLRQVAREFQTLHWARVAFNVAACASIFVGYMRFYSQMIFSEETSIHLTA
jgi:hypothetical protein